MAYCLGITLPFYVGKPERKGIGDMTKLTKAGAKECTAVIWSNGGHFLNRLMNLYLS
jgi:hypothetical protein